MKVGDGIQCWDRHEATYKMMDLARRGVIVKDDPLRENRLIVVSIDEERYSNGKEIQVGRR